MRHFLRLFWCSQNRKSVIFELAAGPRSALSAPDFAKGEELEPKIQKFSKHALN